MIFVFQTQYSSTEAGGGGNLAFLDRLKVSCTNGGALTSFKLERQGSDAVCKRPRFLLLLRSVGVACARMPPDSRASRCGFDRRQRLCHTCPRVSALAKR